MKDAFAIAAAVILFVAGAFFVGGKLLHHIYESPDAWTIIRQPTNDHFRIDNYGYVCDHGSWHLGFSNKESAVKAMKEDRWHSRHPVKVKARKAIDEWKVN